MKIFYLNVNQWYGTHTRLGSVRDDLIERAERIASLALDNNADIVVFSECNPEPCIEDSPVHEQISDGSRGTWRYVVENLEDYFHIPENSSGFETAAFMRESLKDESVDHTEQLPCFTVSHHVEFEVGQVRLITAHMPYLKDRYGNDYGIEYWEWLRDKLEVLIKAEAPTILIGDLNTSEYYREEIFTKYLPSSMRDLYQESTEHEETITFKTANRRDDYALASPALCNAYGVRQEILDTGDLSDHQALLVSINAKV